MKPIKHAALLVLAGYLGTLSVSAFAAPKTDILIFTNGDRLTGEIRSLKRGRLSFNTDATGTIAIEWDKVSQVISDQHIQVETNTGARFFGTLKEPPKDSRLVVDTSDGPQMLDPARVIVMNPIDQHKGFAGFDIDVSLGYNFAKSTGVKQGTFAVNMEYRTLKRLYSMNASSILSDSDSQEASQRQNLALQFTRLWSRRWTTNGNFSLEHNDELGLDLRTSAGFGGGRYLIQSNTMLLSVEAGLQIARENLADEPEDVDSVEAVFTGSWDWFRFESPELDWSSKLQLIPSLTDTGRLRAEFDTSLQWEIIGDLDFGISFYTSYDNKSQTESTATSDYGVNTALTYEF